MSTKSNGTTHRNGTTVAKRPPGELVTCPLCDGAGELARRELLRAAGLDDVLEAVGPRLVELFNERGAGVLMKTKELVEETLRRDNEVKVAQVKQALGREHERERLALERELEKTRTQAARAQDKSEKLAADFALARKALDQTNDELVRLRNTAAKKGEAGEIDFVEAMRPYKHIKLGEKEGSAGDYVVSVAVEEGGCGMRLLENALLVDVKRDKLVGAADVRKIAADARSRGMGVAVLVAISLRSKHPVDDVTHVDGVLVVTTTLEEFVSKVALLTPYLSLRSRLANNAGAADNARERLGELADRVVSKVKELSGASKQVRAIQRAADSLDSIFERVQRDIVTLCADAAGGDSHGTDRA
jgi:hypothetical protein